MPSPQTVSPYYDRVAVGTITTGTGAVMLGAAINGTYQSFSEAGVVNGSTVRYVIVDGDSAWEIGTGVYSSSGQTMTRTPQESSNGGSAISLDGSAVVFLSATAADLNAMSSQSLAIDLVTSGSTVEAEPATVVVIDKTVGSPTAVGLPIDPAEGVWVRVKDRKGDAFANNITVVTTDESLIDGQDQFVMAAGYQDTLFIFDGQQWGVYA